ncbi:helix-turn-helix domain-containing protein [Amycolatopsis nigrescens]|uniref:PucR family transcriptional regulator n=1 Tax=Amycolatopsis nigrescens TaxID=381445 RepID=UPI000360B661|nr:PucR family transcriptional regulator [Amycolatopsis nigrescens]
MAKAILTEIQRVVPEYAEPLNGPIGRTAAGGIEKAILYSLDHVGDPGPPRGDSAELFRHFGELEFRHGRGIDSLQSAYRVGGRVAWRHIAACGQSSRVPANVLCLCAEALFAYVDEISALSVAGYTAARAEAEDTTTRRRRRLLQLLLADPPTARQTVAELARAAGWQLPEWVTMVALEPRAERRRPPVLDGHVLVDTEAAEPCLLIAGSAPDPARLETGLTCWRAVVGPRVPLADAGRSLRCARRSLELLRRGVLADSPVTLVTDHLATLCLLNDEFLIGELRARCLAPLDDLSGKQRERLSDTLLVWLRLRGSAPELAAALDVHPQTVRYRMRRLQQLFGDRLNDPDERLNLEIALRAERLLRAAR